jgi:hypothetical protein
MPKDPSLNGTKKYKRFKFVPGIDGLSGLPSINFIIDTNNDAQTFYYKQGRMDKFFDTKSTIKMNSVAISKPKANQKQAVKYKKKQDWIVCENCLPSQMPLSSKQSFFRNFLDKSIQNPNSLYCIETFLPSQDIRWINLMNEHSSINKFNLNFPQQYFRGCATDVAKIPNPQPNLDLSRVNFRAFEAHLLQLYFNHVHPFLTLVHPGLLYLKLSRPSLDEETQLLVCTILAIATKYLHIKPFEGVEDPLLACQYYQQRAIELYNKLLDRPSLTILQATILLPNLEYQKSPDYYATGWDVVGKLKLQEKFLIPKEEIIKTRPPLFENEINEEYMIWEENIMIWSCFVFKTLFLSAGCVITLDSEEFYTSPHLVSAIDALFSGPISSTILGGEKYQKFWYLHHSIAPTLAQIIVNNKRMQSVSAEGLRPSKKDHEELRRIKLKLNNWLKNLDDYQYQSELPTKDVLMVGLLLQHYHFCNIFLFLPYIPHPDEVSNFLCYMNRRNMASLIRSIMTLSFYASAQNQLFFVYGSASRFYIYLMTLAVSKILKRIWDLTSTESPDNLDYKARSFFDSAIPLLTNSLKGVLGFEFFQFANQTLIERLAMTWIKFYRSDWSDIFMAPKQIGKKPKLGNGILKDIM